MGSSFTSLWAGIADWGPLALQVLLSAGVAAYAVALVVRARTILRQGLAATRTYPGPLVGLLCGIFVVSIMAYTIALIRAAGIHAADAWWHANVWLGIALCVCGSIFPSTSPGRIRTAVDEAILDSMWAHPRQMAPAFAVATGSWLLLPASMLLRAAVPEPVGFMVFLLWPLALLAQIGVGIWWWRRHGSFVEIADGQRTRLVPSFLLHPVCWGWLWGTAFAIMLIVMLGQAHAGP